MANHTVVGRTAVTIEPILKDAALKSVETRIRSQMEALRKRIQHDFASNPVKANIDIDLKPGWKSGLHAQLKTFKGKVRVDIETKGNWKEQLKEKIENAQSVRFDIDYNKASARAAGVAARRMIENQGPAIIEIRAKTSSFDQDLRRVRNDRGRDRDFSKAFANLTETNFGISNIIHRGAVTAHDSLRLLITGLVALSPALIAMASSAGFASLSLLSLGSAALGVTQMIGGVAFAFSGVIEAVKASSQVETEASRKGAQMAQQRLQQAMTVENAERSLANARETLANSVEGVRTAESRFAQSQVEVARAQERVLAAQKGINEARKQAKRDLEDMRDRSRTIQLDIEDAIVAAQQADERVREAQRTPGTSALDRRALSIDAAQAHERVKELLKERKRLTEDLRIEEQKGVNGSDRVVAAQERYRDAVDGVKSAIKERGDAEKAISAAQREVVKAQRDVALAEQKLATARSGAEYALDKQSAAQAKLNDTLAEMSPIGRTLVRRILALKDSSKEFRRSLEEAIFPGVLSFMDSLADKSLTGKSTMDIFADGTLQMGKVVSQTMMKMGTFFKSPLFQTQLAKMQTNNAIAFERLGNAFTIFLRPFSRIFGSSSTLLPRFAGYIERIATEFDRWVGSFTDAELDEFFKKAGDELSDWWDLAVNLGRILLGILRASFPAGSDLVENLGKLTDTVADWANKEEGQKKLKGFFDGFINFLHKFDYKSFFEILGGLASLAGTLKIVAAIKTHPFLALLAQLAIAYPEQTADVMKSVTKSLGGLLRWAAENEEVVLAITGLLAAMRGIRGIQELKMNIFGERGSSPLNAMWVRDAAAQGGKSGGNASNKLMIASAVITAGVVSFSFAKESFKEGYKSGSNPLSDSPVGKFFHDPLNPMNALKAANPFANIAYWLGEGLGMKIGDKTLGQHLKDLGTDIVKGLFGGMATALSEFKDWVAEKLREHLLQPIWDRLEIRSPSKVFERIGKDCIDGLKEGLLSGITSPVQTLITAFNLMLGAGKTFGQTLWSTIVGHFNNIGRAFMVAKSTFTGIFSSIWTTIFNTAQTFLRGLWNSVVTGFNNISRTFGTAKTTLTGIWSSITGTIFGVAATFWKNLKTGFSNVVNGISIIWNNLKAIAAKPINFIITDVYMGGIVKFWNNIRGKIGLGDKKYGLPNMSAIKFATGGVAPGYGNKDTVPAMLTPGEGILTKGEMKKIGGPKGFERLRQSIQYFAKGGVVKNVPFADLFNKYGNIHGLEPALLAAIAKVESGFNPRAVSPAGAQGLMQFMPGTARAMGVHPFNPASAVDGAAKYMKTLLAKFKNNLGLALTGYNMGPYAVNGVNDYARKVMDWMKRFGGGLKGLLANFNPFDTGRKVVYELAKSIADKTVRPLINKIPGEGMIKDLGKAYANKALDGMMKFIYDKDEGVSGGGPVPFTGKIPAEMLAKVGKKLNPFGGPELNGRIGPDSGVWRYILALVKATGIPFKFGNSYRTTDALWHSKGRAIDFSGFNQDRLAEFFMGIRKSVRELIHTTNRGGYYISNGRRVGSMGEQNALHRNHLHVAMDGVSRVQPGWFTGYNNTGKPETLVNADLIQPQTNVHVYIGDEEITDRVRTVVRDEDRLKMDALSRGRRKI